MKKPNKALRKIKTGKVNVSASAFEPKNVKVRISIMVDGDVLEAFRAAAAKRDIGYQTLINQKLREAMAELDSVLSLSDRVSALEKIVMEMG